jgi:hypothetical protein
LAGASPCGHQGYSVGPYYDEVANAIQYYRLIVGPNDTAIRLALKHIADEYIARPILISHTTQRRPGTDIVPREPAGHTSNSLAPLEV